jgi:lipid II:glycine glycyltransferase (peptidoglycan interpeptide bridge formation enzyme)
MAPYLLQWEMIKYAKSKNFKFYDFWGADEKKWPGVTRFKSGFAPKQDFTLYVGAYDYSFNKLLYQIYGIIKKIMI